MIRASAWLCALAALFLVGCVRGPSVHVESPTGPRFTQRPVHVMASSEMSPDCRAATYASVVWFQHLAVSMDVTWVTEDHPSIALEPRPGQVSVHAGIPTTPNALAETYTWHTLSGAIDRAEIVLGFCDPWVMGHELGHALGLDHQVPEFELMHRSDKRGKWGLSPAERAHIRD